MLDKLDVQALNEQELSMQEKKAILDMVQREHM